LEQGQTNNHARCPCDKTLTHEPYNRNAPAHKRTIAHPRFSGKKELHGGFLLGGRRARRLENCLQILPDCRYVRKFLNASHELAVKNHVELALLDREPLRQMLELTPPNPRSRRDLVAS